MAVKNAVSRSWTIAPSSDGKLWSAWPAGDKPSVAVAGLNFASNNAANSDVRLVWSGADLLPRTSHTAIWEANYTQQAGYYAVTWHTSNDGTWHGSAYEFGCHPHPCGNDTVDGNGQRQSAGGAEGTLHWQEIAGLGVGDFISSPSSPGPQSVFPVTKGVWYKQARTCEIVSGSVIHTFYPDLENNPTLFIRQTVTEAAYNAAAAAAVSPAFVFGCSPWTVSGSANSETPSGIFRGIRLFNAALSASDIVSEANGTANAAVTTAGQASVWYINISPTPSDVTAKAGSHSPVWANANRPTLWEP